MESSQERMHILDMIERGTISAEEGYLLLKALTAAEEEAFEEDLSEAPEAADEYDDTDEDLFTSGISVSAPRLAPENGLEETAGGGTISLQTPLEDQTPQPGKPLENGADFSSSPAAPVATPAAQPPPDLADQMQRWRRWWRWPLWIGAALAILSSLGMYAILARNNGLLSGWFLCASLPFVLSILVMVFAWQSRTSLWLHLRLQQAPGAKPARIAFSFPLPLGVLEWFWRLFGDRVPGLKDQPMEEILQALRGNVYAENPIYVHVAEGEHGEQVELYIG